ncbi:SH3 domain-containing protein 1 [Sesamum alatum]|uniref:SH3 domain-containing protein 1 n=1 Tax=Sesamum alatum TaxID=300844 RepID=A0AAE1YT86_9LAMI|nr:SH3 domain-containing protein 1 [Sesamum alatum]
MEAIKKQASKLREQVARQQQTILRQLGQLGHGGVMIDEADVQLHQQLQNLYKSTRAAKHFQRDIVRGLDGFVSTSKKQMEIARKLAEDCCKYGIENQDSDSPLARIAQGFGTSHASMEDQRETMLAILGYQVSEPLRALINGAPLEDARHLTHQYDRMRQEFEIQAAEVIRRQSKSRDISAESALKLKSAEKKLTEIKSSMLALGREATAAMLSVEDQQQETTFQKLLIMVDAERSYHRNVVAILEKLHSEMILEEQMEESSLQSEIPPMDENIPSPNNGTVSNSPHGQDDEDKGDNYFISKVIHPFDAQADGELSLEIDDCVVVRQVTSNGWSEGECKGKAGWFPSAYVEKIDRIPTSKLPGEDSPP